MNDVDCPYCGEPQEINHDDGYGYSEDEIYEQECSNCEKMFTYTTSISFYYKATKADCLNGGEHKFSLVIHTPRYWPNWVRCSMCGHEEKGKYQRKTED